MFGGIYSIQICFCLTDASNDDVIDAADDDNRPTSKANSGEEPIEKDDIDNDDASDSEQPPPTAVEEKSTRLFHFHMVNSYGNAEVERLYDDGRSIKFCGESLYRLTS